MTDIDLEPVFLLLALKNRKCFSCGTTQSPQWRRSQYHDAIKDRFLLCNACGLKSAKGQFCSYCLRVYYLSSEEEYVTCDRCGKHDHASCAEFVGRNHTPYRCKSHYELESL